MTHVFYINEFGMPLDPDCYEYITTLQSEDLGDVFRRMNHVDGSEEEALLMSLGVRSMMVGDVCICTTGWGGFRCASAGWEEIDRDVEVALLGKVPEGVA